MVIQYWGWKNKNIGLEIRWSVCFSNCNLYDPIFRLLQNNDYNTKLLKVVIKCVLNCDDNSKITSRFNYGKL